MKGTIMNRSSYIFILPVILLLLGGCSQEELVSAGDNNVPDVTVDENTVTLSFQLARNASADTRAEYSNEDMMKEEGNVESLIYAIFYKKTCKKKDYIDLPANSYQTGNTGNNHIYTLSSGLEMDWFDENTEIFAVVNAPEEVKDKLFTETPTKPDKLTIENEIIKKLVVDEIEWKTRKYMYDIFIGRQLKDNKYYPKDGKLHYKPANTTNCTESFQYNLSNETIFSNYDDLIAKRQKTTNAEILAMYDAIIEDLSCRYELYDTTTRDSQKSTYTKDEETNHTIANGLIQEPEFLRYFLWREYSYTEDLNLIASNNASRLIDSPLMSGYLALADNVGSVITVPVEHVYSRIWFQFNFTGDISALNSGAKYIDLTGIKVEGLTNETLLFNVDGVNSESEDASTEITSDNTTQSPFFGNLTASGQQHYGYNGIEILRYYLEQSDYNIICRYPLKSNTSTEFDMSNARRYYIYSFQRSGNKLTDNPKITLNYSFTEKGSTIITNKTATAYLYDETHSGGKRHHGLLRNYTYGVNCMVNANTLGLELQVTAHDWYTHKVTDIPTFE